MFTTRLRVRLKEPSLSRNWKVLTLSVASLTLVISTLSLARRIGDHVLMPNVKTWEKERRLFHVCLLC